MMPQPRPEIEQAIQAIGDICHEQYLGSWKRPDTYDEYEYAYKTEVIYLLDDPRVKEVLQSLIAQEADKLANKRLERVRDGIRANSYFVSHSEMFGQELGVHRGIWMAYDLVEAELDKGDSHENIT